MNPLPPPLSATCGFFFFCLLLSSIPLYQNEFEEKFALPQLFPHGVSTPIHTLRCSFRVSIPILYSSHTHFPPLAISLYTYHTHSSLRTLHSHPLPLSCPSMCVPYSPSSHSLFPTLLSSFSSLPLLFHFPYYTLHYTYLSTLSHSSSHSSTPSFTVSFLFSLTLFLLTSSFYSFPSVITTRLYPPFFFHVICSCPKPSFNLFSLFLLSFSFSFSFSFSLARSFFYFL